MANKKNIETGNDDRPGYTPDDFIKEHKGYDKIPTLFLENMVLYPGMSIPVTLTEQKDIETAALASASGSEIFLVCLRPGMEGGHSDGNPPLSEEPSVTWTDEEKAAEVVRTSISAAEKKLMLADSAYAVGIVASIYKTVTTEQGVDIYLHTYNAAELQRITTINPVVRAKVKVLPEQFPADNDLEMPVLMQEINRTYEHILTTIGVDETREVLKSLKELDHPLARLNFISVNSPLDTASKQDLLETRELKMRAQKLALALNMSAQLVDLKAQIAQKTSQTLSRQQKEHFLRQQINAMQEELGGGSIEDEEMDELDARAEGKKWSKKVRAHFDKEMRKLERFNASSPEYGIQYGYLETMLNLPWEVYSKDNFDISQIEAQLDKDHYGLEKVKERIVEHVAVMKLRQDMKAPIMCLYGPRV